MVTKPEYLNERAAEILDWPDDERVHFVEQPQWIPYPRAKAILGHFEDLLAHARRQRMPNTLLVGSSGNGKTTIINRLQEKHPVRVIESTGDAVAPVVVAEMPSEPSESRFWTEVLTALRIPHRDTDATQRKEAQALSVLETLDTRLLVIDELHNMLHGGGARQRNFLATLKRVSNKLNMPLVGVGTGDAIAALRSDPQLESRFDCARLKRWELNEQFLQLLKSFERQIPLARPSNLTSRELAMAIYNASDQTIGSVDKLLTRAAVKAIRTGHERIDERMLDEGVCTSLAEAAQDGTL